MRISDWSSDVCSSDLLIATDRRNREADLVDRFSALAGGDDDLAGTQTFPLRRFGGCGLGSRLLRRSPALGACGRTEAKTRAARCVYDNAVPFPCDFCSHNHNHHPLALPEEPYDPIKHLFFV